MAWATLVWAPAAMVLAWLFYGKDPSWSRPRAFVKRFPNLYRWVNAKYYVDEFYEAALIGPCKQLGAQLWRFDSLAVDGMVNGAAQFTLILAGRPLDRRQDRGRPGRTSWPGSCSRSPRASAASRAAGCRTTRS